MLRPSFERVQQEGEGVNQARGLSGKPRCAAEAASLQPRPGAVDGIDRRHLTGNQHPRRAARLSGEPRRHGMQPRRLSRGGRCGPGVDGISNTVHPWALSAAGLHLCGPDWMTPSSSTSSSSGSQAGAAPRELNGASATADGAGVPGQVHLSSVAEDAGGIRRRFLGEKLAS